MPLVMMRRVKRCTFTEGVSNLYAAAIELTGNRDSSGASSLSSYSWLPSPSSCSLDFMSSGCARPFSTTSLSDNQNLMFISEFDQSPKCSPTNLIEKAFLTLVDVSMDRQKTMGEIPLNLRIQATGRSIRKSKWELNIPALDSCGTGFSSVSSTGSLNEIHNHTRYINHPKAMTQPDDNKTPGIIIYTEQNEASAYKALPIQRTILLNTKGLKLFLKSILLFIEFSYPACKCSLLF
nr:hypothetical protein Iba_chr13aCG11540 [Ipomoea batatas]